MPPVTPRATPPVTPPEAPAVRRDATRAVIVDAAARLLSEHGSRAVTTRAVAQEAGVQAPTLYRLFGDKDGLLDAVAEHVMATYVSAKSVAARLEGDGGGDPLCDLRAGWQLHLEFGLANPDLYTLLHATHRRQHSTATAAGMDILRDRVHRLARSGRLRVDERRAVDMIHAAGSGAILALLAVPADERDLGLSEAMFDAVIRAILSETPVTAASETITTAVAFKAVVEQLPALSSAEQALMVEWLARVIASLQDAKGIGQGRTQAPTRPAG